MREPAAAWAVPFGLLDLGCIAAARGDTEGAVSQFRRAIPLFVEHAMALEAALCKRALGELVGGDEGKALIAEGDAFLVRQRVKNADRMARCFVPRARIGGARLLSK